MTHDKEYGVRFEDGDIVGDFASRSDVLAFVSKLDRDDATQVLLRMRSPWMVELQASPLDAVKMPRSECSNCKGTNLGFEVHITVSGSRSRPEFYQGCNDCSETLWLGDWDTFHAVLALLFDIRIPRCD